MLWVECHLPLAKKVNTVGGFPAITLVNDAL